MDKDRVFVGLECEVRATGTSSSEIWTVKKIVQNKSGDWEVFAKGNKTAFNRTFTLEQLVGVHSHMAKEIVSESGEVVGTIDGLDMHIENINYMPHQERRGRKSEE